jgi:predicted nucleic acid-binding protein
MGRATARKIVALYAEWPVVQVDVPLAGRLLTEDLQHGRVVGGVRIDNPFA